MKKIFIAMLVAFSPLTFAAKYDMDAHTQVFFTVSHVGFSNSTGSFSDIKGTFEFDPANLENSSTEVTIGTESLYMGDDTWKSHLSGEKWFDMANYPTMTFKSTKTVKTGEKTMDVTGDLTIKGQTHPVVLKVVFNKAGMFMGHDKAGFSATTTFDRTLFGVSQFAGPISKMVEVKIEVEGETH